MTADQLTVAVIGMMASFAFGYVLVHGWARAKGGRGSRTDERL